MMYMFWSGFAAADRRHPEFDDLLTEKPASFLNFAARMILKIGCLCGAGMGLITSNTGGMAKPSPIDGGRDCSN